MTGRLVWCGPEGARLVAAVQAAHAPEPPSEVIALAPDDLIAR